MKSSVEYWLSFHLLEISDYVLTLGGVLAATLAILMGFVVSRVVRKTIAKIGSLRAQDSSAQIYTLGRIVHYVLMLISFIVATSFLGVSFDKLAIIAGALGVGIGFGLQSIVNNFVCGIIILFEKSLKVGDLIELESGVFGEVIEINIRSTLIRTGDNIDMLIPNSEFINGRVTNWTLEENIRRFRIPFGVAYGSDKDLVRKAALEAADSVSHTLKHNKRVPVVLMTGFGESSLDFELAVWVNSESVKKPAQLTSDYLWALDTAFRKYEIEIPFPQRDLHVRSGLPNNSF